MSIQVEKIRAGERKCIARCDLAKHGITWGVICFLGWQAIKVLQLALQAKPATLSVFAQCLKAWNIPAWLMAITSGICATGWRIEYRRNVRLTTTNGDLRHQLEKDDAVHTRSGLDETGATPKGDKE
ncbi:MAG: hypothetical protein IKO01_09120 [Kiritimatiellae bacterium]|nr:hypothetical protein [Kiritimatiellia bacterium]